MRLFGRGCAQKCRPEVLAAPEVQRALGLRRLLDGGEWVGFLRAAASAPYLQACLAHMYFSRCHARALAVLARTSGARPGARRGLLPNPTCAAARARRSRLRRSCHRHSFCLTPVLTLPRARPACAYARLGPLGL
jgi:hypothetical protein